MTPSQTIAAKDWDAGREMEREFQLFTTKGTPMTAPNREEYLASVEPVQGMRWVEVNSIKDIPNGIFLYHWKGIDGTDYYKKFSDTEVANLIWYKLRYLYEPTSITDK